MTAVLPHAAAAESLRQLPKTLKNYADFERTIEALAAGSPASIDGVWGSACALVAAALAEAKPTKQATGPLVMVLPTQREADDASGDLELFLAHPPKFFPAWETADDERLVHDETFGERLRVLKELFRRTKDESPKSKVQGPRSREIGPDGNRPGLG